MPRMNAEQIHERLVKRVEMVLFGRRNLREVACQLAQRPEQQQRQFIDGVDLIVASSIELAYLFCQLAEPALERIPPAHWRRWVMQLMDRYDSDGVAAATVAMQQVDSFTDTLHDSDCSVALEDAKKVLESFLVGLTGPAGRPLKLLADPDYSYSDTETLRLPPMLSRFTDRSTNFRLYKAMLVHQWAQHRYGSWRVNLSAALARFDDPDRALTLFHSLERLRLDACICRDLPGMGREMVALREQQADAEAAPATLWQHAAERLSQPDASVHDSHQLLHQFYASAATPAACCYQGELRPTLTEAVAQARQRDDKQRLAKVLRELIDERRAVRSQPPQGLQRPEQERIGINQRRDPDTPDGLRIELTLDDEAQALGADAQQLINAIFQDIGDIPEDYLQAADPEQYREHDSDAADKVAPRDDRRYFNYDEWDSARNQYRKHWCQLQEREMHPAWDDFVPDTLNKYRRVVKQLRRSFEVLRGEDRRLRKQPYGDDVDLDAVIESIADQRAGLEPGDNLFIRHERIDRDIAVLFMVDMSRSTSGWVSQTEREALVLLCESLQILGDRYAVYGFTSNTRKCCEALRIKTFDEAYSPLVQARISGIRAREYTRMGAIIRHLTGHLQQTGARTRLLITLSDGRPDDIDGYRGHYGIEDTRQAVIEARAVGVHPFCITIDDQGMDYLPRMFGANGFAVVDRVERLPFKVSDIYRRLTM